MSCVYCIKLLANAVAAAIRTHFVFILFFHTNKHKTSILQQLFVFTARSLLPRAGSAFLLLSLLNSKCTRIKKCIVWLGFSKWFTRGIERQKVYPFEIEKKREREKKFTLSDVAMPCLCTSPPLLFPHYFNECSPVSVGAHIRCFLFHRMNYVCHEHTSNNSKKTKQQKERKSMLRFLLLLLLIHFAICHPLLR